MKNYLLIILLIILTGYTVHFVQYEGSTVITEQIRAKLQLDLYETIKLYIMFLYVVFSIVIVLSYNDSNRFQRVILLSIGAVTVLITTVQYRIDFHSWDVYMNRIKYNEHYKLDRWFYVFGILMIAYAVFASGKKKYLHVIGTLLVNAFLFINFYVWFIDELGSLTV